MPIATPREPITDFGLADLMMRTGLRNAVSHHRDGVPVSDNFERARKMISPKELSEQVASQLRSIVVDHAAGKGASSVCDENEAKYIFNKPPVETLETELAHMEKIVDPTSFSSLSLLGDLYMEAGYDLEAHIAYEKALKVARENGGTYTE